VTFHNPLCRCGDVHVLALGAPETGLQNADNGMFENTDVPYVKNLSTKNPDIGHMLRQAGYYTAYKGKVAPQP